MYWFWLWSLHKVSGRYVPFYLDQKLSELSESLSDEVRGVLFAIVWDM